MIMDLTQEKKFGYGCMRLPLLDPKDPVSFDYDLIEKLFDTYLEKGFTYFDTAYTYHAYHAEEATRKSLVERHQRTRFNWLPNCRYVISGMPGIWKISSMSNFKIAAWIILIIICFTTWG